MPASLPIPPEDSMELYRLAVEEYRFQVEYNWKRTQQMMVFNTAVLAAGVAVAPADGNAARWLLSALVFAVGLVAVALSVAVVRTQHGYYRAARDRMHRIEAAAGLPEDWRIDTTATLGQRKRWARVQDLVVGMLAMIGIANVTGFLITLVAAL